MEKFTVDLPMNEPVSVKAGTDCVITVRNAGTLNVSFAINAEAAGSHNETITLFSTDEEQCYRQEKTFKDNVSDKDDEVLLRFTGLTKSLNYSLEVAPGEKEDPYLLFKDKPFGEWMEDEAADDGEDEDGDDDEDENDDGDE